jgi:hypothetical protein
LGEAKQTITTQTYNGDGLDLMGENKHIITTQKYNGDGVNPTREGNGEGKEDGNVTNDANKNDEQHHFVINPSKLFSKVGVVEATCFEF